MVLRTRFLAAYALLALLLAASGTLTWRSAQRHRPGPLAPGAVALVERFLDAVQRRDLKTACRMFSAFPSCDRTILAPQLQTFHVEPAELAVDGFDVPATLNDEYAIFSISERLGRYRIVDIIADPAAFSAFDLPSPYAA